MDSNSNKVGIRKLPKDYMNHGIYEQHYFDTIEQAQNFVDDDWEKENKDYGVMYMVAKPTNTWYYSILPTSFSFNNYEKYINHGK